MRRGQYLRILTLALKTRRPLKKKKSETQKIHELTKALKDEDVRVSLPGSQ